MPIKSDRLKAPIARASRLHAIDPGGHIVDQLHAYYSSIEEETIPRHLLELLERLDEAEESAPKEPPRVDDYEH